MHEVKPGISLWSLRRLFLAYQQNPITRWRTSLTTTGERNRCPSYTIVRVATHLCIMACPPWMSSAFNPRQASNSTPFLPISVSLFAFSVIFCSRHVRFCDWRHQENENTGTNRSRHNLKLNLSGSQSYGPYRNKTQKHLSGNQNQSYSPVPYIDQN